MHLPEAEDADEDRTQQINVQSFQLGSGVEQLEFSNRRLLRQSAIGVLRASMVIHFILRSLSGPQIYLTERRNQFQIIDCFGHRIPWAAYEVGYPKVEVTSFLN